MSNEDFSLGEVEVALTPVERFDEFLQTRGMRRTPQRRIIVEEVFRRHEHFEAEDLINHLQGLPGERRVSRPTIYRTLAELVEAGLLREVAHNNRRSVYEHDYGYPQHDHLQCSECKKLIEFHSDEIARIRDAVAREHRFRATGHRLTVSGVCHECAKARRRHSPLNQV
ncbi:MAG: transcriptional repressor [Pirellulales bacterium]|nr:transcriptional repressor [Pirellulales bacterium]